MKKSNFILSRPKNRALKAADNICSRSSTPSIGTPGSIILVLFCLTCALLAGCAKQEIANVNSKGKNIICFGDSLTFGYGAEEGGDYPAALSKMIGWAVLNKGVSAETSFDALKRIKEDVLDNDPYLVIVEFSGNDFIKKIPIGDTMKNIQKIVEAIQSNGAMVALVDVSSILIMNEYSFKLRRLSRKYKTIFVGRVLTDIFDRPALKSDFIHPNEAGYKLIAQRVYKAIEPYLK